MEVVSALKVYMNKDMRSAEEKLLDNCYEDVMILKNYSYDSALIGVSDDNRAVYDYDLMIEYLIKEEGFTEIEAIEWTEFNSIRAISYMGSSAPIVMHRLLD